MPEGGFSRSIGFIKHANALIVASGVAPLKLQRIEPF